MNIVEIIEKYNLSIRRIPDILTETNDIRHYREGDEIVILTVDKVAPKFKKSFAERFPEGRKFCRRYKVPENAGKYMVKRVDNNFSAVSWDARKDNLADTLEGSIELFLAKEKEDLI